MSLQGLKVLSFSTKKKPAPTGRDLRPAVRHSLMYTSVPIPREYNRPLGGVVPAGDWWHSLSEEGVMLLLPPHDDLNTPERLPQGQDKGDVED